MSTPPHIYIETQGINGAPITTGRRAVAVFLDVMKQSSNAAFERYLEEHRQHLSAWQHLRSTGGELLDNSVSGAIAAEAAARIRTLANDHANADVHLLLRCPSGNPAHRASKSSGTAASSPRYPTSVTQQGLARPTRPKCSCQYWRKRVGTMMSMAATVGGSSEHTIESHSGATTLFAPTVRYASTNESQFDPCMDWRAELWLGHLDLADEPDVLGGYADFLTIRLGEHPVADMLDSLSQDAENFAGLFNGKYVDDSVQDQFEQPFNTALILLTVLVAGPLRGHDLGAWLAADVISRMASATDTLVLLYPHPAGHTPEDVSEIDAIDALNRYWLKAGFVRGLVPLDEHPGFLGQSTAYTSLPDARHALEHAEDLQIPLDTGDPRLDIV